MQAARARRTAPVVYNTSNVLMRPLAEKVQLSSTERTTESTPRPGAAEMPKARCYSWFWRRFDEKQRANS